MFSTRALVTDEEKYGVFCTQYDELEAELVYYNRHLTSHRLFILAMEGEKVVGMVCLKDGSTRVPGALALTFVSVRSSHRQQGVAKLLVSHLFAFAKARGQAIANTQYEEEGQLYLRPLLEGAAASNPDVVFHEFPYNLR